VAAGLCALGAVAWFFVDPSAVIRTSTTDSEDADFSGQEIPVR